MASIDAEACSYSRVDDEEPPSTTVQFLSPRAVARLSRPKRPRATAERDIFSPGAPPGRTPRSTFQTRAFRKAFYPDVADQRVERLALAGPKPHPHPGPTRAGAGAFGRRAGGPVAGGIDAPGEHHALLHEPGLARRPQPAAAADRDSHARPSSSTARARPTIRWAKTTTAPCRAWSIAIPDRVLLLVTDFCSSYCRYCTRSRVVGHGAIAPSEARLEQAFDYIRRTPSHPRRAHLRRRSAGLERRAAGLDSRPVCGRFRTWSSSGSARKCRPCCRSGSRRNCAGCSASTIRCG